MNKNFSKNVLVVLGAFLILEALSLAGFGFPLINQVVFFVLLIATVVISAYSLENGLLLVLAELLVGSKGYLFYFQLTDGRMISLRLAMWSVFMLVFLIRVVRQYLKTGKGFEYGLRLKKFIFWRPFIVLASFVLLGIISGLIYRNGLINIFLDVNAWLYFLIILPAVAINLNVQKLKTLFLAGAVLVGLKTLILLGVFSNNFVFSDFVYAWLRKTLVGEMTFAGDWNRVFIQSQIFPIIAYFFLFFKTATYKKFSDVFHKQNVIKLLLAALFLSTLLISLSRSFWVAFAGVIFLALILIWRQYGIKQVLITILSLIASSSLAVLLIISATPKMFTSLDNQLTNRVGNKEEAALVSRWSLLPELFKEIKKNPVSGQGFGATVTYVSSDPRVVQNNPDGLYTTYAFEWGYLDTWLKIGILGLLAYLWLLVVILKNNNFATLKDSTYFYWGLAAALVFLAIVNIFTPYLNHPLGIGVVVVSSCLISKDRVY